MLGYRSLDEVHTFDTDGMPIVVEHVINDIENNYFTTAKCACPARTSFIDWVGGVFYFDARGHAARGAHPGQHRPAARCSTTYDPTSKAVFANATLRPFGEQLELHRRRPLFEGREGRQLHQPRRYEPERERHPFRRRAAAEQGELEVRRELSAQRRHAALHVRRVRQLAAGLQPAAAAGDAGRPVRRQ